MSHPLLLALATFIAGQDGLVAGHDPSLRQRSECTAGAPRAALHVPGSAMLGVSAFRFPHLPMAGTIEEDMLTGLWMDLDPAPNAVLDWNCTDRTYNGHQGIDLGMKSWFEKRNGVPVFAASDGIVVLAQDGWPDENLNGGVQGNIVAVDHGGGYLTWYFHLALGSVAVSLGQPVKAGQQLALAASSGNSFGPHLHFGVDLSGTPIDPDEGPCNAMPSLWVHPPSIDYGFHLYDAGISRIDLTPYYPPAIMPASNQLLTSDSAVRFWNWMINLPPQSDWRVVFRRPNGSVAFDSFDVPFGNPTTYSQWWTWWEYGPTTVPELFTLLGTWTVEFRINGAQLWSAPLEVRTVLDPNLNHPPKPIAASFEPSLPTQDDPVMCRVATDARSSRTRTGTSCAIATCGRSMARPCATSRPPCSPTRCRTTPR
jgi:hypothetical protein